MSTSLNFMQTKLDEIWPKPNLNGGERGGWGGRRNTLIFLLRSSTVELQTGPFFAIYDA